LFFPSVWMSWCFGWLLWIGLLVQANLCAELLLFGLMNSRADLSVEI
jgi:hypothetical protein